MYLPAFVSGMGIIILEGVKEQLVSLTDGKKVAFRFELFCSDHTDNLQIVLGSALSSDLLFIRPPMTERKFFLRELGSS